MGAVNYNLVIEKGSKFSESIIILDGNKDPINLDGFTAFMKIKSNSRTSSTTILELTTSNGRISITPAEGLVAMSITAEDTAAITYKGIALYDLELLAGSDIKKLIRGTVSFKEEITN